MMKSSSRIFSDLDVEAHPDYPLGADTWFGIGGTADMLLRPRTVDALGTLIRRCHENEVPLRIFGNGANLLVADEGVDGIVVHLSNDVFKHVSYNVDGAVELARAMAGADMAKTLNETVRRGLAGLQQMAGIPASIGGAIRMNAGGAFGSIGDAVHSVGCLNNRGELVVYPAEQLLMGYRQTNIPHDFILWATFHLEPDNPTTLRERVLEIFQYKKSSQPLADSSAGCVFKNPTDPDDPSGETRISAGALIDRTGLKGRSVGGAEVSTLHGNFLLVQPGATATDLLTLMEEVRTSVHADQGVLLQNEVVVWRRS